MKKKSAKWIAYLLMGSLLVGCGSTQDTANTTEEVQETKEEPIISLTDVVLPISENTNPLVGNSEAGEFVYGGDPAVLVDGDTVYLYTGHDASTDEQVEKAIYEIPEYFCYSSTDLIHWNAEGVVMSMDTVDWTVDDSAAWAAQVAKHYDKEKEKELYYLYFCSWDRTSAGKQSIGVAVSESPTGPFVDIGQPLVRGSVTKPDTSSFNDIDPTVWIETDESGEEHRYLAWGNGIFFICELNEDMISVKDQDADGKIKSGNDITTCDILTSLNGLDSYTEAPWLYRRQNESGEYYGDYYLFYAHGWRESMAYATTSDLLHEKWNFGNVIMFPNATSNTNHMSVFDFKGKTYFVCHNGSLPGGNGYRRSACITELEFNEDGTIDLFEETASGIAGTTSCIALDNQEKVAHESMINSSADVDYPITILPVGIAMGGNEKDSQWVIRPGKADGANDAYRSIESENKPGLYWTVTDQNQIVLSQDVDASEQSAKAQTFHVVSALNGGEGVSFESITQKGMFITLVDGKLELTDGTDTQNASFYVTEN